MSNLIKPYRIILYGDEKTGSESTTKFINKELFTIGSTEMESQFKAFSPKITEKVNGAKQLSFTMYDNIYSNITGEKLTNPFIPYIVNERKVGLEYEGKTYYFLIKDIKVDSEKKTYSITAEESYITELSKNGFNLEMNYELNNNLGTATELGKIVFKESDWKISDDSEKFIQTIDEALVELTINTTLIARKIIDRTDLKADLTDVKAEIPAGSKIYGFYSSCTTQPYRFQFIYVDGTITKDDDRIIITKDCQYYIDGLTYSGGSDGYYIPKGMTRGPVSQEYRGRRYVYSPKYTYSPLLKDYLDIYTKGGEQFGIRKQIEYKAPIMINDYATNGKNFKSTSGWRPCYIKDGSQSSKPSGIHTIELKALDSNDNDIYNQILAGQTIVEANYTPTLVLNSPGTSTTQYLPAFVNSCLYDNRGKLKSLVNGKQYVVEITCSGFTTEPKWDLSSRAYNSEGDYYEDSGAKTLTNYKGQTNITGTNIYYKIFTIEKDITEAEFKNLKFQFFISNRNSDGSSTALDSAKITEFHIYDYVEKAAGAYGRPYYIPTDTENLGADQTVVTTYEYYPLTDSYQISNSKGNVAESLDEVIISSSIATPESQGYTCSYSAEKVRSINIKESNYFNAIQTICETFECWADFQVSENVDGSFTKEVVLKNYIGQENYAGFKYGINLKSIQRTDSSKQIVSKLIVKQNKNQFGTNGFCTIARAPSNYSGENYLFDFQHYVNQGLINAYELETILYTEITGLKCSNYYYKIREQNKIIDKANTQLIPAQAILTKAKADYEVNKGMYNEAVNNLERYRIKLRQLLNVDDTFWATITAEQRETLNKQLEDSNIGKDYMAQIAEARRLIYEYGEAKEKSEELIGIYEAQIKSFEQIINNAIEEKRLINTSFYTLFSRFIQEGTWIDENYYDDEKYYIDAQSVLYNSSQPAVSYTINVIDISGLEGYQGFTLGIGDKTFIEDVEFFGYKIDENGNITGEPYREEVTVTELTKDLDDPSKNTIKIQTYKNQFADLFKKVTATIQQVKYTTGAYERAAALAEADTSLKLGYLKDALESSALVLQNMGAQSVKWDDNGITVQDSILNNKMLRLVSQGILFTTDGGESWKTAITADGIATDYIAAGAIDTSKIQIIGGSNPSFTWDVCGLNAYDTKINKIGIVDVVETNYNRFVRFDRFGIYGFDGAISDKLFHPDSAEEIMNRNETKFALTWEGLKIKVGENVATIGKMDEETVSGTEDKKIPIISAGNEGSGAVFKVYSDGSLYATGAKVQGNIAANSLLIKDGNNILLDAGFSQSNRVSIGGWTVTNRSLIHDYSALGTRDGVGFKIPQSTDDEVIYAGYGGDGYWSTFRVKADGSLYASKGTIGGWDITSDRLQKQEAGDTSKQMVLCPTGAKLWVNGAYKYVVFGAGTNQNISFAVDNNGYLYAKGADISGKITAMNGSQIAGFQITPTEIKSLNSIVGMCSLESTDTKTYYSFWAGNSKASKAPFSVTSSGAIKASSGSIGGWEITTARFDSNGYIVTTGGTVKECLKHKLNILGFSGEVYLWENGITAQSPQGLKQYKSWVSLTV